MKTKINKLWSVLFSLLLLTLFSSSCTLFNGEAFSGSSETSTTPVADYYYGAFEDVPIPRDMAPTKEEYVVYTQGNTKVGYQVYSGRVEITSLNRAMQGYMAQEGWVLDSG